MTVVAHSGSGSESGTRVCAPSVLVSVESGSISVIGSTEYGVEVVILIGRRKSRSSRL